MLFRLAAVGVLHLRGHAYDLAPSRLPPLLGPAPPLLRRLGHVSDVAIAAPLVVLHCAGAFRLVRGLGAVPAVAGAFVDEAVAFQDVLCAVDGVRGEAVAGGEGGGGGDGVAAVVGE